MSEEKKVYLVTQGQYSDYGVVRVFSTEELARRWIGDETTGYDAYDVEVYSLDDMSGEEFNKKNHIRISMRVNGEVLEVEEMTGKPDDYVHFSRRFSSPEVKFELRVRTLDRETAIKTASEIRGQILAKYGYTPGLYNHKMEQIRTY